MNEFIYFPIFELKRYLPLRNKRSRADYMYREKPRNPACLFSAITGTQRVICDTQFCECTLHVTEELYKVSVRKKEHRHGIHKIILRKNNSEITDYFLTFTLL